PRRPWRPRGARWSRRPGKSSRCRPTSRATSTKSSARSSCARWSARASTARPRARASASRCARCATAWRAWASRSPIRRMGHERARSLRSAHTGARSAEGSPMSAMEWDAGWWRRARRVPSPNFGPRPEAAAVDLVVLHSISLPPGEYGDDSIERLFTNTLDWSAHPYFEAIRGLEVSSHFVIRRDGELLQFVSVDDRAWHAGKSSWEGRDDCNSWSIGIELEGLEGDRFEPAQLDALVTLLRAIDKLSPVRHVVGHEHVAPGRKA